MSDFDTDRESLEKECEVEFIVSSGPGGQHRNRSRTGVRLTHPASGQMVMATERRSQRQNLDAAFERMAKRLDKLNQKPKNRLATRPSKARRAERLQSKKQRGQIKKGRQAPRPEDD